VSRSTGRRKFFTEVRRRGWLVVLSTLVAAAAAWGIGNALPQKSSAEAVLVVRAGGPLAEQPSSSARLAATYAALIPLDSKVEAALYRSLPSDSTTYSSSNDPNTAVLRLNVSAASEGEAIEGSKVLARALTGRRPASRNILPNSVAVASLPTSGSSSVASADLLVIGALLGLLLGFVLLAFWRPRDARVDNLPELRRELDCPCFEVHVATGTGLRPLFDALANDAGRTIVVIPCTPRSAAAANSLSQVLNNAFGKGRAAVAAPPGSEEAGELSAANADTAILVLDPGARIAALREAVDILGRYEDAKPDYAVFATDRSAAGPKQDDDADGATQDLAAVSP
jgi:hypothetical protein